MLIEDGDTVKVNLTNVSLAFAPDNTYLYTSTLDYVEPGTYSFERGVLYTLPAGAEEDAARKVKVELLDSLRLQILMNDAGKLRQLHFLRVRLPAAADADDEQSALDSFAIDTTTYLLDSAELEHLHHDHDE